MTRITVGWDDLVAASRGLDRPAWAEPGSRDVVVVELDGSAPPLAARRPPVVVAGLTEPGGPKLGERPGAAWCDVVLPAGSDELDAVTETVGRGPVASAALAVLLRDAPSRSVAAGLVAESATYSALQAGPEFAAWRSARPPRRPRLEPPSPIRVERSAACMTVTLHRPHVRNALNTAMADALINALAVPVMDDSIERVEWRGAGPDFCAGGDLDEFGTFPDPAAAHLLRLGRSPAAAAAAVADRLTAFVHGSCVGSGIELAAFARRVVADPAARFALPELGLGLIPGAGGTVSLVRRIGRHETARLALTARPITATAALALGLVDELAEVVSESGPGARKP